MNKIKPHFGQYIAECCLKDKYNGKYSTEDYYALANFCEYENINRGENLENYFYVMQRYYINSAATNIVIDNLPSLQQRMLFYYYKRNYNLQQISYQLFVSTATLSRLRTEILDKLEKALFYKISLDDGRDIFNRNKILSMINLIDYRLTKILAQDKQKNNFDKIWIQYLVEQRSRLAKLLQYIEKVISDDKNAEGKDFNLACIVHKINNPDLNVSLIAQHFNKTIPFISQRLKNYKTVVNSIFDRTSEKKLIIFF